MELCCLGQTYVQSHYGYDNRRILRAIHACIAMETATLKLDSACLQVPDIMSLQSPQDLKLEEGVAAVVKFGLGNLFSIAAKV